MLEEIISLVRIVINAIPGVIMIIACYLYLKKEYRTDGVLMLTGTLITLLIYLMVSLYFQYFYNYEDFTGNRVTVLNLIIKICNLTGAGIFSIGFAIAINKYLKLTKQSQKE